MSLLRHSPFWSSPIILTLLTTPVCPRRYALSRTLLPQSVTIKYTIEVSIQVIIYSLFKFLHTSAAVEIMLIHTKKIKQKRGLDYDMNVIIVNPAKDV